MNVTTIKHGEEWKLIEFDYHGPQATWSHRYVYHNVMTREAVKVLFCASTGETFVSDRYKDHMPYSLVGWNPVLAGSEL